MAFNLPVQNYFARTAGPTSWTRPVDWPVITDTVNEVQFLMSDLGDASCRIITTFSRTSGTQNIIIDWGDATTTTVTTTASTVSTKTYTPGTGTPCSLGYTTFVVRVYFTGVGVSVLTGCSITALLISGNTFSTQSCGVLEAYYGNGTVGSNVPSFYSAVGNSQSFSMFNWLQYVKLPATVSWTNISNMFNGCNALAKVVMPTSASGLTSLQSTFSECFNLEELTFPSNATGITSLLNTFQVCTNLKTVSFPTSLNSCTSATQIFFNCFNLRYVTFPSINAMTSFTNGFQNCYQLEWVKFNSMPTAASVNFNTAFNNCFNLQTVYFPATGTASSVYDFATAFSNCFLLKNIVFPSNINVSSFNNTFGLCTTLVSCILPTATPSCTTFSGMFSNCYNLLKATLPTTAAAGTNLASTFSACVKLQEVTIPNTLTIGNMQSMFNTCTALKTINWTPGAQNSLTTLNSAFLNCYSLVSVNLPTSMTGLNLLNNAFNSCRQLQTVTLPASLNAVSSVNSMFANCDDLVSVTLPTSMSSCTDFASMFNNCKRIQTVTLPNTVSASTTTFSAAFNNCNSLKTVTFPGAAQLSLVNSLNTMFSSCSNLTTINNFNFIGSLTATPLINAGGNQYNRLTSISFRGPLSLLALNGPPSTTGRTDVQSVRLLNTSAGQWTGSSPQINVSYTNMSQANLVQLFNDMAAQGPVTAKTINITLATGASALTAGERAIITSIGWTIIG